MSIFEYISYGEFIRLVVSLSFDVVEYIIPSLMTPFVGDIFDIVGLASSIYMFSWIGLFAALELIPWFDIIPINTITWLLWVVSKRWDNIANAMRWEL